MLRDNDAIVLIIDNEESVRESIQQEIYGFGYDAVAVDGVPAALQQLRSFGHGIACIVTDFRLPGASGPDFVKKMKECAGFPPVIILTENADLELAIAAIRSGAFDFLTKPVDSGELRQAVERARHYSRLLALERQFSSELEEAVIGVTLALKENKQKLLDLTGQLLTAEEQERHRIATELHDNIGQTLAFTKMKLLRMTEVDTVAENRELVASALESLDAAIKSVRTLTTQISPPLLYEVGLEAALECLGDDLMSEYGLAVELQCGRAPVAVTEEQRVVLFRAVRELLINVIKHSGVDRAVVSVCEDGERVVIEVCDQGTGFDETASTNGFGLFSIRQKMLRLGGSFVLSSATGKGTAAQLILPRRIMS